VKTTLLKLEMDGRIMNDKIFKLLLAIMLTLLVAALTVLLVAVAQMIGGWLGWVVDVLIVITFFVIWRKID
jgi:hypothetical protein